MYLGEGKENKKHGFGLLKTPDGVAKAGRWNNGEFVEPKIALFSKDKDWGGRKAKEAREVERDAQMVVANAKAKVGFYGCFVGVFCGGVLWGCFVLVGVVVIISSFYYSPNETKQTKPISIDSYLSMWPFERIRQI